MLMYKTGVSARLFTEKNYLVLAELLIRGVSKHIFFSYFPRKRTCVRLRFHKMCFCLDVRKYQYVLIEIYEYSDKVLFILH